MTGVTQAEFYKVVEFLFRSIWSETFRLSSFSDNAEGVLCIARLLKYPFSLTKSVLTSLAPHHTPTLIGFLGWLAELVEIDLVNGIGPTTTRKADAEMPVDELWLQYLTNSFRERRNPDLVEEIDAEFEARLQHHITTAQDTVAELEGRDLELKEQAAAAQRRLEHAAAEIKEVGRQAAEKLGDIPKLETLIQNLDDQRREQEARCGAKVDECAAALERARTAEARAQDLRERAAECGVSEGSHRRALAERDAAQKELDSVQGMLDSRRSAEDEAKMVLLKGSQENNAKLAVLRSHLSLHGGDGGSGGPGEDDGQLAQDAGTGLLNTDKLIRAHNSLKNSVRKELKNKCEVLDTKIHRFERENLDKEDSVARLEAEVAGLKKTLEARQDDWEVLKRNVDDEARGLKADLDEYAAAAKRARAESRGFVDNAASALAEARRQHEDAVKGEGHKAEKIREWKTEYVEVLYYLSESLVEHKDSVEKVLQYLKEQSERLLMTFQREAAEEENDIKEMEQMEKM